MIVTVVTLGDATICAGPCRLTPAMVRPFALLLRLSADPGQRLSRPALCELLFPRWRSKNALHSLREIVYQFRQAEVPITLEDGTVSLHPTHVSRDYYDFAHNLRPTVMHLRAIEGGFLPGYQPRLSRAFAIWLSGFRERSTFALCKMLMQEWTRAGRAREWDAAERAARACLAIDPLNEGATMIVAERLAAAGSGARAVDLLDAYLDGYAERVARSPERSRSPAAALRRRLVES